MDCESLNACGCQEPPCAVSEATLSAVATVAPTSAMPPQIRSQKAHNNLDIVWHDQRLFLSFRTAPSHFASDQTRLYVVSTSDHINWRFEGEFYEETDLREPRFLSLKGRLFLFYARLGTDRFAFEPGQARQVEYVGPERWTAPVDAFEPGFIPWRIRVRKGEALLTGYTGGETIYSDMDSALEVYWLKSSDGLNWQPVVHDRPVVLRGGVSETAFAIVEETVTMIARNEAGDSGGFGSRICSGPRLQPDLWRCADDPKKYDSPEMFVHRGQVFLLGRRHLSETGHYDQQSEGTLSQRRLVNQANYWQRPKRCALWKVDSQTLSVEHVLDLPTAGDTCFASVLPLAPSGYLIYDYRSTTDDLGIGWLDGQNGATEIYRTTLELP
jgi:hypothetical protein